MGKYHTVLVTALYRCALFLVGECISFDSGLVREFCQKTLTECLQSSSDCFQNVCCNHFFFFYPDLSTSLLVCFISSELQYECFGIMCWVSTSKLQISRNICKSIDKNWESRPFLIFDMLNITLKSTLCECKVLNYFSSDRIGHLFFFWRSINHNRHYCYFHILMYYFNFFPRKL